MSAAVERDVQTVNRWQAEGKTLGSHKFSRPPFRGGHDALVEGERVANAQHMKGAVRLLFLKEVGEGWIAPADVEGIPEAGLLDWLSKPLAFAASSFFIGNKAAEKLAGSVEAPGGGSSKVKRDPSTGALQTTQTPGIGEAVQSAVPSVGNAIVEAVKAIVTGYGLRLLEIVAGAGLVLFGLYTLARGETPKLPAAVPV